MPKYIPLWEQYAPHIQEKRRLKVSTYICGELHEKTKKPPNNKKMYKSGVFIQIFPVEFPTKMMDFDQVIHISAELSTERRHLSTVFSWLGEKWTYSP